MDPQTTGERRATVTARGDTEILITRRFAAPAAAVWRAWTEPDLVSRWWPGRRGTMTSCEIDLRVGGRWRYAMRTTDGMDIAFHGEYREIVPAQRLVSTETFEAFPDASSLNTLTLAEADGLTTLEVVVTHELREHRDMHIASGMEAGLQEGMDLLEAITAEL